VLNKTAGMVTHPGFGNRYGTLVNALLYHFGLRDAISLEFDDDEDDDTIDESTLFLKDEIRPGIVHRLDKDTSGLLVIAKNSNTHSLLLNNSIIELLIENTEH
jgi:23S rRNA pseudouridine1911/1915/1917 synthase